MQRFQNQKHNADAPAAFICGHCGRTVAPEACGTVHRNHCPYCLWSCHLDDRPGDRRAYCRGEMEPVGVWVKPNGEWSLLHRCSRCGSIHAHRIAGDDDAMVLLSLAVRPLASPPFPLESVAQSLR